MGCFQDVDSLASGNRNVEMRNTNGLNKLPSVKCRRSMRKISLGLAF